MSTATGWEKLTGDTTSWSVPITTSDPVTIATTGDYRNATDSDLTTPSDLALSLTSPTRSFLNTTVNHIDFETTASGFINSTFTSNTSVSFTMMSEANYTVLSTTNDTLVVAPYDRDSIRYARFYLKAFIIFPGIVFNTLSLLVFAVGRMRHTTAGKYLLALTIFDMLVLLGELLHWLTEVVGEDYRPILGLKFRDTNEFACKFTLFLRYYGRLLSAWTTIIITGERFITVNFPLKVSRLSTTKISKVIIVTETLIGLVLATFPFYTVGVHGFGYCGITDKSVYNIFMWITVYLGDLILPSIIVCILTGLIILTLFRARSFRRRQAEGQHIKSEREFQLTLTLTFIAIAFVVLRLPYCVAFFLHINREKIFPQPINEYTDYTLWAARDLTGAIAIMNYMVNFFLYAVCGSAFRNEFRRVFCCVDEEAIRRQRTIMSYANGSSSTLNGHNIRRSPSFQRHEFVTRL